MHELANFFGGSTPLVPVKRIAVYARLYASFSTIPRQAVGWHWGEGREKKGKVQFDCVDTIDRFLRDEI